MKQVAVVAGARPQFIKAAALWQAWNRHFRNCFQWKLIHTGQHFDFQLSEVFFQELGLPAPDHQLQIQDPNPATQLGNMISDLAALFKQSRPDILLVFGDTRSTLAAAVVAAELQIPLAHVEAGLRSFRRDMPEEHARRVTDHLSTWLFAPSLKSIAQIHKEGINQIPSTHILFSGDIMYDATRYFSPQNPEKSKGEYLLCTLHRNFNTDNPERLKAALDRCAQAIEFFQMPMHFPMHPRTLASIHKFGIKPPDGMQIMEPLSYTGMLAALQQATFVATDSGGLQKEAYFLGKPCICFRNETEWVELQEAGWVHCADVDEKRWEIALREIASGITPPDHHWYGDGNAGEKIFRFLEQTC